MEAELEECMVRKAADSDIQSLPSWRAMHADTSAWAEEIQFKFFRDAPPWRKLEMAAKLTKGMLLLSESGIKSRYPQDSTSEIRRRLADVLLGPELAGRVYGRLEEACEQS
jgi:hypothetical protein